MKKISLLNKPRRRRVRFSQKDKNGKPRILKNEMLRTKNSQVSTVKIESEKLTKQWKTIFKNILTESMSLLTKEELEVNRNRNKEKNSNLATKSSYI